MSQKDWLSFFSGDLALDEIHHHFEHFVAECCKHPGHDEKTLFVKFHRDSPLLSAEAGVGDYDIALTAHDARSFASLLLGFADAVEQTGAV